MSSQVQPGQPRPRAPSRSPPRRTVRNRFLRGRGIAYTRRQAALAPGQTDSSARGHSPRAVAGGPPALPALPCLPCPALPSASPARRREHCLGALAGIQLLLIYIFSGRQMALSAIEGYPGMLKTCPDCRVNGHVVPGSDGMALGGALMGLPSHQGHPTSPLSPY